MRPSCAFWLIKLATACDHFRSFSESAAQKIRVTTGAQPEEAQTLSELFDQLGEAELDELAKDLALLWDAWDRQFGGLDAFINSEHVVRNEYLGRLARTAERFSTAQHRTAARYARSTTLMLAYLKAFTQPHPSSAQIALGSRMARVIQRGQLLCARERAARSSTASALIELAPGREHQRELRAAVT
jgi:hypothetical protein